MSENINSIPYLEQTAKWLISGHPKRNLNEVSTFIFGKDESNPQRPNVEFWKEHFFDIFDKALHQEGFKLTHLKYDVSPYFLEFNYIKIEPSYKLTTLAEVYIHPLVRELNVNTQQYLEQMAEWVVDEFSLFKPNEVSYLDFNKDPDYPQTPLLCFWKEHFYSILSETLNKKGFKLVYLNYDNPDHFLEFYYA